MKKDKVLSVIMIILVAIAVIMAGLETVNEINDQKIKPDVTYEFTNKNIDWS